MHSRFWLLALLLGSPLLTLAQAPAAVPPAATYQVAHDSLLQRAARIRTATEARITRFKVGFAGLGGTRRVVSSYAQLQPRGSASAHAALVKRQLVKHKTHGVEVEKLRYYDTRRRLLLYECYEQHQLVHQVLREYQQLSNGYLGVVRSTEWVRGDYLRQTERARPGVAAGRYYYAAPRPLN